MAAFDPRSAVEAPIRQALARLILGGTVVFAFGGLALGCGPLCADNPDGRIITHLAACFLLGIYLVGTQLIRMRRGRPDLELRNTAWERAYEVDRADARMAAVVTAAVPAGIFAALAVMIWPHLMEKSTRPEEYGLWLPAILILWVLCSVRWVEEARDHIARALRASEQRLRVYWSAPGAHMS